MYIEVKTDDQFESRSSVPQIPYRLARNTLPTFYIGANVRWSVLDGFPKPMQTQTIILFIGFYRRNRVSVKLRFEDCYHRHPAFSALGFARIRASFTYERNTTASVNGFEIQRSLSVLLLVLKPRSVWRLARISVRYYTFTAVSFLDRLTLVKYTTQLLNAVKWKAMLAFGSWNAMNRRGNLKKMRPPNRLLVAVP